MIRMKKRCQRAPKSIAMAGDGLRVARQNRMTKNHARRRTYRAIAVWLTAVCVTLSSCTLSPRHRPSPAPTPPPPSAEETAARATIDIINATAGGPIDEQRAILEKWAAPAEKIAQHECPAATTTLEFAPAWRNLRPDPITTTVDTSHNGVAYLLPTLIRIYDGERITGTDMVSLRLWIRDNTAYISALCVA